MQPYFDLTRKKTSKKMEDHLKWKTNQSTKINLIGCDTFVNSPSLDVKKKTYDEKYINEYQWPSG
jgi:hypothetical protein